LSISIGVMKRNSLNAVPGRADGSAQSAAR
jgi:hypothetical protein